MIRARQACFCGLFQSATTAFSQARSAALTSISIPWRMPDHHTAHDGEESYECVSALGVLIDAGPSDPPGAFILVAVS
jgi:hypothetical protein